MWFSNCMSTMKGKSLRKYLKIRYWVFVLSSWKWWFPMGFQQMSLIFVETGLQVSCLLTFHPFAVVWAQPRTWTKCRHRSLCRRSGEVWKAIITMKIPMPLVTLAALLLGAQASMEIPADMGSMSLSSVASALANMADQVPTNGSTLQSIKDYIAQMLADVTTQHNIAQAELTEISGYTSCDGTMASELSALAATTTVAATTTTAPPTIAPAATTTTLHPSSIALKTCLAEVETLNASLTKCLSEHKAAKEASDAVCMNFHFKSVIDAKAERCNESFSGSYEQYLERDVQILADYVSKKQNCTTYTSSTDAKASECDAKEATLFNKQLLCSQIVVVTTTPGMAPAATTTAAAVVSNAAAEEAACTNYHKQVEVCSDYDSCYEAVTLAKSGEKQSASTLEASRKAEWVSLQRMSCLVNLLGTSNQAAGMATCMSTPVTDYNTGHLDLVLPSPPTKKTCGPFQKPASCSEVTPAVPEVLETVIVHIASGRSFRWAHMRGMRDKWETAHRHANASAKKWGSAQFRNHEFEASLILLLWFALNIYIIIFRTTLQLDISLAGFWRNLLPQLRSLLLTWQHQIHHMRQLPSPQLDVWSMLK